MYFTVLFVSTNPPIAPIRTRTPYSFRSFVFLSFFLSVSARFLRFYVSTFCALNTVVTIQCSALRDEGGLTTTALAIPPTPTIAYAGTTTATPRWRCKREFELE
jgi:hypothetical protein